VVGSSDEDFLDFVKSEATKDGYRLLRLAPGRLDKLERAGVRLAEDCNILYLSYWLRQVFNKYYVKSSR